jgi:hypothetical protein
MNDTFIVPPSSDIDEYKMWDTDRWDDRIYLLKQMWRNGFGNKEIYYKIIADLIVHAHDLYER